MSVSTGHLQSWNSDSNHDGESKVNPLYFIYIYIITISDLAAIQI